MSAEDNIEVPEALVCPISHQLMLDPVVAKDGYSYERKEIEEWIMDNPTSPMTREPLLLSDLTPNRALKDQSEKFLADNPSYEVGPLGDLQKVTPKRSDESCEDDDLKKKQKQREESVQLNVAVVGREKGKQEFCIELETEPVVGGYDLVCVIDRSGSMSTPVEAKGEDGKKMNNGLTIMDITKHAIKTLVSGLKGLGKHRIAVISFDDSVDEVFPLVTITKKNEDTVLLKLSNIHPRGSTNLWGGLNGAIKMLASRKDKSRSGSILLFTDGVPTQSPRNGEVEALKSALQREELNASVHTFGFGYKLKPSLLYDLAVAGHGMNGFIPDGTFVGTIFVNALAAILTTRVWKAQLHVIKDGKEAITDLGGVQFEQPRHVFVKADVGSSYYVSYYVDGQFQKTSQQVLEEATAPFTVSEKALDLAVEAIRNGLANSGRDKDVVELMDWLKAIELDTLSKEESVVIQGLLDTLESQVFPGLQNAIFFRKWGHYYMDSLSRAIHLRIRHNFKDAVVQCFGGDMLSKEVDRINDIFDSLLPPKPSRATANTVQVSSMRSYNRSYNPCFAGECLITMADGSQKAVKDLVKGDVVSTPMGPTSIVCVLETRCKNGFADVVAFKEGLIITPWHPIKLEGSWVFPGKVKQSRTRSCEAVFSLVLEEHHIATISGVDCICLGHSYQEDVIRHDYFGSQKVIDDLKDMKGWNSGRIVVKTGCIKEEGGLVTGLVYNGEK